MSLDTVFDLASLTKVVATTTAMMQLVEQGTVRLTDPVASWVPGFERFGKGGITVRHLLTHVSGLRPDVDLGEPWKGYEAAIDLAVNEVPTAPPGERFVYSDINFFLLGHIVARASGEPLEQLRDRPRVRAARHDRHRLPAAARARRPHRAHRALPLPRCLAVQGARGRAAARRRARSHGATDGRRRRPRRALQHRPATSPASCACCSAAAPWAPRRVLAPLTVAKMITPATPAGHERAARPRLGRGHELLGQPRRADAARLVRPHRLHRHVDLGRSATRSSS